jgi:hypothetical protein
MSEPTPRRFWIRKILQDFHLGSFNSDIRDYHDWDQKYFFDYFRMNKTTFQELLGMVGADIEKKATKMRNPISAAERLCMTVRFLSTGQSQQEIAQAYRHSPASLATIIPETCAAIWERIREKNYITCPSTHAEWKNIAHGFDQKWNFPNCVGAIDGKHVVMRAPANQGSEWYNYKGTHSIVLMAICDAFYRFTFVNVGESGRRSDAGVYVHAGLDKMIGKMNSISPPMPSSQTANWHYLLHL